MKKHIYKDFCPPLLLLLLLLFSAVAAVAQPKARFSASAVSGCLPLVVNFTNTSTGGTSYYWKFGNGSTSVLKDPGTTYIKAGTYFVTLVVDDGNGNKDSVTQTITANAPPLADFSAKTTSGCAPLTVSFANLSTPGTSTNLSYVWDFGDGQTSTSNSPTHTYTVPGNYDIKLLVKDQYGCMHSKSLSQYISVTGSKIGNLKAADSFACQAPITTTFSAVLPPGTYTYKWTFSDGQTSTAANPKLSFKSPGTVGATLEVVDGNGCKTSYTKSAILSIGRPKAIIEPHVASICEGMVAQFQASILFGSQLKYQWKGPDGKMQSGSTFSYKFTKAGTHTIQLYVINSGNCVDSASTKITVDPKLVPGMFVKDTLHCEYDTAFVFKNLTAGSKKVKWFVNGDFRGDDLTNFAFSTTKVGKHKVKLVVENESGCIDSIIKNVWVAEPLITLNVDPAAGCVPLTTTIKVDATFPTDPLWVRIDYGDGSPLDTSLGERKHTYEKTGVYNLVVTVAFTRHCYLTESEVIRVGTKPKASFKTEQDTVGCLTALQPMNFINTTDTVGKGWMQPITALWMFGDGSQDKAWHGSHKYDSKPDTFDVTLIIFSNGCPDTFVKKKHIVTLPPYANFSLVRGCDGISFEVADSSVGGDTLEYYAYYLGEHISYVDGPGGVKYLKRDLIDHSNLREPTFKFTKSGTYLVVQFAHNDSLGCVDTGFVLQYVEPVQLPNFKSKGVPGCVPVSYYFTADLSPRPKTIQWDFGDGDSATGEEVHHIYTKPGLYTVKMKFGTDTLCWDSVIKEKLVRVDGPTNVFRVENVSGCVPLTVRLIDSSHAVNGIKRSWYNMGNGDTLNARSPVMYYTYNQAPTDTSRSFTITHEVWDGYCYAKKKVKVYPKGTAALFSVLPQATCDNLEFVFIPNRNTQTRAHSFEWTFSNGKTARTSTPHTTFPKGGQAWAKLKVTDSTNCVSEITQYFDANSRKLKAKFNTSPREAQCPPVLVNFTNTTDSGYFNLKHFKWYFGDGTTSTLRNPAKIYNESGIYNVTLVVIDSFGCKDSIVYPANVIIRGPSGTYTATKASGCGMVTTTLTAKSKNASRYIWDLGDGTLAYGDTVTHTYNYPGEFKPLLILSDSLGCSYILPPKVTITVYKGPTANFYFSSGCLSEGTQFTETAKQANSPIEHYWWDFGDGDTSNARNPLHFYKEPGTYSVTLRVISKFKCVNYITKNVIVNGVKAKIKADLYGCVGDKATFTDLSIGSNARVGWEWDFGDGSSSTEQHPQHVYKRAGYYTVRLLTSDVNGCFDTAYIRNFLVGDTMAPPDRTIRRATVENDNVVRLEFNKFKEPDFKNYLIYRRDNLTGALRLVNKINHADDTVYLDRGLNTRRESYCYQVRVERICGVVSQGLSPVHCTVELSGAPDINKSKLRWNAYTGWPVSKYVITRERLGQLRVYDPIDTVAGNVLSYVDSNVYCYAVHRYRVVALKGDGVVSYSDTCAVAPIYIPQVPVTRLIRATVLANYAVQIEWQAPPRARVMNYMLERSIDGIKYAALDSLLHPTTLSYIDKNVDVRQLSYFYRVRVMDSCRDLGAPSNIGKTVLLKADTNHDWQPVAKWSPYEEWDEGVDFYELYRVFKSGHQILIGTQQPGGILQLTDTESPLSGIESKDYCYQVVAHSKTRYPWDTAVKSYSNTACAPAKSVLQVPNVFTPNHDGLNDSFMVKSLFVYDYHILIVDRWGTIVYESSDIKSGWNGYYKGKRAPMDSYRYIISAKGADGKPINRKGWVTILL